MKVIVSEGSDMDMGKHTFMKSFIWRFSMRTWSSCCSAPLRLLHVSE